MTLKPVSAMDSVVLRGVMVSAEPRTLTRPARAPSNLSEAASGNRADSLPGVAEPGPDQASSSNDEGAYDHGFQQGFEDGYAKGWQEGLAKAEAAATQKTRDAVDAAVAQAQKSLRDKARKLQAVLDALSGTTAECIDAAQDEMAVLAFEVVCRVLGEHAATPAGVRAIVDQALKGWRGRQPLIVHLHPEDARLLQHDDVLAQTLHAARPGQLQWRADPSVAMGGCMLHSLEGGLDARLEVQLGALKELLVRSRATVSLIDGGDERGAKAPPPVFARDVEEMPVDRAGEAHA